MEHGPLVKVTSPSFARDPVLREEIIARFPRAAFNPTGLPLAGGALAEFLADADAAVIGVERVDEALLAHTPALRLVAKYGDGLDNIDAPACERRGVAVGWTPGVNATATAELTLGLMLALSSQAYRHALELRGGAWSRHGGTLLSGKTVGVVGCGHVGREVVRLLSPFGCRLLGNDVADLSAWAPIAGVRPTSKEEIFRTADVVTLHVPLTVATRRLVDARALATFRPTAVLVNTSHGQVVDHAALEEALRDGRLGGAALDVHEEEPLGGADLLALPNVIGTPHIGDGAREAVLAMGRAAIGHLEQFFGSPRASDADEWRCSLLHQPVDVAKCVEREGGGSVRGRGAAVAAQGPRSKRAPVG
jgi:D-3-phosphoglycerate dehydrogenase